jgi:hypothetical protein
MKDLGVEEQLFSKKTDRGLNRGGPLPLRESPDMSLRISMENIILMLSIQVSKYTAFDRSLGGSYWEINS